MTKLKKSEVEDIKELIRNAISGCYEQIKPDEFDGRERLLASLIRALVESGQAKMIENQDKMGKLQDRINELIKNRNSI